MTDLKVFLLGTPRIEFQGKPVNLERRKALALVAYLAIAEQPQSRDIVASLLWPDLDESRARATLRSTLPSLTRAVPIEWLDADRTTLALKRDATWVDVHAFLAALGYNRSHNHSPETLCEECVERFRQAAALYQGDFLSGFALPDNAEYDHWLIVQREWLRRELAGILRRLAHFSAERESLAEAIGYARHWLSLDPLHEPAQRSLIRLYATSGQRSEALRQYQQCVELLDAELATPPEEATTQLYQAIQDNRLSPSPSGDISSAPPSSILPPLPSLVIGRQDALGEIKRRLGVGGGEMRPVTLIQGWPGVGKSTTAALLAHDPDIAQQFSDGVLWASLGEQPDLLAELTVWADTFNLVEPGRTRKIEDISAQLATIMRDKRILLIVDDVWGIEHATPFRVAGQFGATVITTRLNDVATALAPTAYDIYRLPVLTEDAGLELLGKLTPEMVAEHPDDSRELVRDLEGLPLAIHVAGRLLHSEARLGWGVSELLAEIRKGAHLLGAEIPSDMVSAGRDTSPTVSALLKRSTDALDLETRQRFAFLGLFAPKPATFDLQAMAVAWDVPDPKPTARMLVKRGLLEPLSGGRFQMHALLVLHARSLLEEDVTT